MAAMALCQSAANQWVTHLKVCVTWLETSGSGSRTGIMTATMVRPEMVQPGNCRQAPADLNAAAPGSAATRTYWQRIATTKTLTAATRPTASASPNPCARRARGPGQVQGQGQGQAQGPGQAQAQAQGRGQGQGQVGYFWGGAFALDVGHKSGYFMRRFCAR